MTENAFFVAQGDARYAATDYTCGPWSDAHQHAGPPAALLARAAEAELPSAPAMQIVRLTVEILRPVPIETLVVSAQTLHPGRRVRLIDLALTDAAGKACLRGRALAVRVEDLPVPDVMPDTAKLPAPAASRAFEFPFFNIETGYHSAMEVRIAHGVWGQGPVTAWMRMRIPLVEGENPSPLARVVTAADSGNGLSVVLDLNRFTFLNPDLTVYLHRLPVDEWIGLDASTLPESSGVGLADVCLYDTAGRIGRSDQSLIIQSR